MVALREQETTVEKLQLELGPDGATYDAVVFAKEGINFIGEPGAGKTNALARFIEQMAPLYSPFLIMDYKGDLVPTADFMPNRWIATPEHIPTPYQIVCKGAQVIFDVNSFESDEDATIAFATLLRDLLLFARKLPVNKRVPVQIICDEAQYFMPQNSKDSDLDEDAILQMKKAWMAAKSRGRAFGLILSVATQYISKIDKACLSGKINILMRQTLDTDIARYMNFVSHEEGKAKFSSMIREFSSGDAIITIPGRPQERIHFYQRSSQDDACTPSLFAAIEKFAPGGCPPQKKATYLNVVPDAPITPVVQNVPVAKPKSKAKELPAHIQQPSLFSVPAPEIASETQEQEPRVEEVEQEAPDVTIEDMPVEVRESVEMFIAEAKQYNALSHAEVRSLGRLAMDGDTVARQTLINHHLMFVVATAIKKARTSGRRAELSEIVSAGYLGMCQGAHHYNPDKGLFTTHASFWIKKFIHEYLYPANQDETVPLEDAQNDVATDDSAKAIDAALDNKAVVARLLEVAHLRPAFEEVLQRYYGLAGYTEQTFEEIARAKGVRRQCIQVKHAKAIATLKDVARQLQQANA